MSRIKLRPTRAANPDGNRVLGVAVLFWTGIRLALELSGLALIYHEVWGCCAMVGAQFLP